MRVLIDEYDVPWETAWALTVATCGYTNHTLLPEALERWPVDMMERVLPRHMQIVGEINRRLLAEVERRFPGEPAMQERVSIFERDRKSTRLNSSHSQISYAVFCLKKKKRNERNRI